MDPQLAAASLALALSCAAEDPLCWIAALLLRVSLGAMFIAHIYWKFYILEGGFRKWWANFEENDYPRWVAYYVVSAEVLGALLLIPGIKTTLVCLYALPLMIGATHFWYVRTGFYFSGAGCELPFVWTIMLVVQALLGDGPFSLGPIL